MFRTVRINSFTVSVKTALVFFAWRSEGNHHQFCSGISPDTAMDDNHWLPTENNGANALQHIIALYINQHHGDVSAS